MNGDRIYHDRALLEPSFYHEVGRMQDFLIAMYVEDGEETGIDTYIREETYNSTAFGSITPVITTRYTPDGIAWVWSPGWWKNKHPTVEWRSVTGGRDADLIMRRLAELGYAPWTQATGLEQHFI
jgi:hypothetical protein